MKVIDGGITAAKGFTAAGAAIGIKKGMKDLALISSSVPAIAAAAFTTNVVKATSVLRNMDLICSKEKISGIAINSGNANACTGEAGVKANLEMAEAYAKCLGVPAEAVMTASTGVIGAAFPIDIVKKGIENTAPLLKDGREAAKIAAESIMTTDTFPKEVAISFELGGKTVTIGAMAKGSGMIHPNMATMLSFICSDVSIDRELLEMALKDTVQDTYNMISVDGDTSTNDTVVVLANGLAENPKIEVENEDYYIFKEALHYVNEMIAKNLALDGEGATKLIEVQVKGAAEEEDAKKLAKSVITSNLVKAAMFGEDANWGRVLCALGYSGVKFDPEKANIAYKSEKGEIDLMVNGTPIVFDEEKASEILSAKEIIVQVKLAEGDASAVAWGCDLTYDYVKINGDYRS